MIVRLLSLENRKVEQEQEAWDAMAESEEWDDGTHPVTTDPI
jgi:hypothetical protein